VYAGCRKGQEGSYTLDPGCSNFPEFLTFTAGNSETRMSTGNAPIAPRHFARMVLLTDFDQPGGFTWKPGELTCGVNAANPWVPTTYRAQLDTAQNYFAFGIPYVERGVNGWNPQVCYPDIGSTQTPFESIPFDKLDELQSPETTPVPLVVTGW
jgi:hypothetical protein